MRTLPRKIESCNGMFLQVQVYSTDSSSPVDNSGVEHLHLNKQILVAARSQFEAAEADGIYWRGSSAQEMNPEPSFWSGAIYSRNEIASSHCALHLAPHTSGH